MITQFDHICSTDVVAQPLFEIYAPPPPIKGNMFPSCSFCSTTHLLLLLPRTTSIRYNHHYLPTFAMSTNTIPKSTYSTTIKPWSIADEMPQQQWVATKYEQRPALAALTGMLASVPIPKIFASNAVPFLMWREEGQEAKVASRKK